MPDRLLNRWFSSSPELDEFIKIPFDYQPEEEDECVIYCLWMVIHYFKNKHKNRRLREATCSLSPDQIMEDMTIIEGGWRPDQDELTMVAERTRTLKFNLQYWQDTPPQNLHDVVKSQVSDSRPVIPFINGLLLREGNRDNNGVHAVVAAGYNDETIAIHDPWGYPADLVSRDKLEEAWDPMFNQIITTSLSKKGNKIIEGEI